ncbi:MAG: efflux RND transporter periplasmic adaptor subunit, partial [Duncaniella sp.]|nr:efflux RND transporter periplasmic adaptor subunit [Duncaniella sp.]
MDRELTKDERKRAQRKKLLPYIIGAGTVVIIFAVIMISLRTSVNRDDLLVSTVDSGTIET